MALVPPVNMEQTSVHLLMGCYTEAERSDAVRLRLEAMRKALPDRKSRPLLTETIDEIRISAMILREIADLSQIYHDGVPSAVDPLNVVLPCLSRSLRDITVHSEDRTLPKQGRWRKMYLTMANEAMGLALPSRFGLYNQFLTSIRELMTSSPIFDASLLQNTRLQILRLRNARGIPLPSTQIGPTVRFDVLPPSPTDSTRHWAQKVFSSSLPSRTALKRHCPSTSFGPHKSFGYVYIASRSKVLFRCTFNGDQMSLIVFLDGRGRTPHLLLRTFEQSIPWFALLGTHELCIERGFNSVKLKRWSRSENRSKMWAALYFVTWEELVLVHSTFLSLKARSNSTIQLAVEEYSLRSEAILFQDNIVEDGLQHVLSVYEDRKTRGIRLQASISEGALQECPVWTAFVTHQSTSNSWLRRKSHHRIHLNDVQLYVLCPKYRQQNQRRGFSGAFDISFVNEAASYRFEHVFSLLRAARA